MPPLHTRTIGNPSTAQLDACVTLSNNQLSYNLPDDGNIISSGHRFRVMKIIMIIIIICTSHEQYSVVFPPFLHITIYFLYSTLKLLCVDRRQIVTCVVEPPNRCGRKKEKKKGEKSVRMDESRIAFGSLWTKREIKQNLNSARI